MDYTLLFILGYIIGLSLLGAYHTVPTACPEFYYNDKVKVITGFYKGEQGRITGKAKWSCTYTVYGSNIHRDIEGRVLTKITEFTYQ